MIKGLVTKSMVKSQKRILFFLLMIFFSYHPSGYGVYLPGGEVSSDTRWIVAESPYIIGGDITIKAGITLTIEPGVEVRFTEVNSELGETNRAELIVLGSLIAVGDINHPIKFTSHQDFKDLGSWGGIYLKGEIGILEYVQVEYALTGVSVYSYAQINGSKIENNLIAGIEVKKGGYLVLRDSELIYNRTGLILAGEGIITENHFHSNSYGLFAEGISNQEITANSFESNNYGIYLENLEPGNCFLENLISGNDYGIFMHTGIPPRVNFNDLYNNTVYDFYNLSTGDVDARYNWWGTTDRSLIDMVIYDGKDADITLNVGYVDYTGYLKESALAPTVVNLLLSPRIFRQGELTGVITFSKEMNTLIKPIIGYGLYSPFDTYVVNTENGKWISTTEYQFSVYIPTDFTEGQYRFRIEGAESIDGMVLKPNINYYFFVDRSAPEISIESDCLFFSPDGDGVKDVLDINIYLNEPAQVVMTVTDEKGIIYGPVVSQGYEKEVNFNWNGLDNSLNPLLEGEYYHLEIVAKDEAGNENSVAKVIPIWIDMTAPQLVIEPFFGIKMEEIMIRGEVRDNSNPVINLSYRLVGDNDFRKIGQVEGNITGEIFLWDAKELDDGVYELEIKAIDPAGNETIQRIEVMIDNRQPNIEILSPADGSHGSQEILITGEVRDFFLESWTLELEVEESWHLLRSGDLNISGELYSLNVASYSDGPYRLRVLARDKAGHILEDIRTIYVDNSTPPEIISSSIYPQCISPDSDGRSDKVTFQLNFSEKVNWELNIIDLSDRLIKRLTGIDQFVQAVWDGTDSTGRIVPDGKYNYRLSYADVVGHQGSDLEGTISLDTIPPALEVTPLAAITNKLQVTLEGEVYDYFQVSVNERQVKVQNNKFVVPLDLTEGLNSIKVIAEDEARNQSVKMMEVIVDTIPPIIELEGVKNITNQQKIELAGFIKDDNFSSATLEIIKDSELEIKDIVLDEDNRFRVEQSLNEGENQFILKAYDQAGNKTEFFLPIKYLPTVPEIELLKPINRFLSSDRVDVILRVIEGSVPIDESSIDVRLDGEKYEFNWDGENKLIQLGINGLFEGRHYLTVTARNINGEVGGEFKTELIVDLCDPIINLTTPQNGDVVDGWDGLLAVKGLIEDEYLARIEVRLKPSDQIVDLMVEDMSIVQGDIGFLDISNLTNGLYQLSISAFDRSGRMSVITRNLEIKNTGLIEGEVRGNLAKIIDPIVFLARNNLIIEKIPFDLVEGKFAQRVPIGQYDLVLAPWGYEPVVIEDLIIETGHIYQGLILDFRDELILAVKEGKQLIGFPLLVDETHQLADNLSGWMGDEYSLLNDWSHTDPGKGYWIKSDQNKIVNLTGEIIQTEYRLPIKSGWNLVSTPYNYPYPLSGLKFVANGRIYSFADGIAAGIIDPGVWGFDHYYTRVDILNPFKGYWFHVSEDGELIFEPENAMFPYRENIPPVNPEVNKIQGSEWEVKIRASLSNLSDNENLIGLLQGATQNVDPGIDLREPPGYEDFISLYFVSGEEKLTASYLSLVKDSAGEKKWEIEVYSPITGWVRLSWDIDPEAIFYIELNDRAMGKKIDMLRQKSYEYYHTGEKVAQFIITAKKRGFSLKRAYNYPNPFSALKSESSKVQTGTNIRYLLTHDADITLEVFDIMGRPVKNIGIIRRGEPGGREGWNEIYWDGRNGRGQSVANGTYVLKITASRGKLKQVKTVMMAVINRR